LRGAVARETGGLKSRSNLGTRSSQHSPASTIALSLGTRYNENSKPNLTYEKQTPFHYCLRGGLCLLPAFRHERRQKVGVADSEPNGFGFAERQVFAGGQDNKLACRENNELARGQDD
jgi:hypothetical protein